VNCTCAGGLLFFFVDRDRPGGVNSARKRPGSKRGKDRRGITTYAGCPIHEMLLEIRPAISHTIKPQPRFISAAGPRVHSPNKVLGLDHRPRLRVQYPASTLPVPPDAVVMCLTFSTNPDLEYIDMWIHGPLQNTIISPKVSKTEHDIKLVWGENNEQMLQGRITLCAL
jgi:hypothetical protein